METLYTEFSPFPLLKTERLLLRRLAVDDCESLFELRKSHAAMKYIPRPVAKSLSDVEQYIEVLDVALEANNAINWGICLANTPSEVIGMIGYVKFYRERKSAEIGYMLNPLQWGNGYVLEAIEEIHRYGFGTIGLNAIEAVIDPRNENSKKILLRSDYTFDRFVQRDLEFEGEWLDAEYYIKYK